MSEQTQEAGDSRANAAGCSAATFGILTFDFHCGACGRPSKIPIKRGWDNPVYVMEMEKQHRLLRDEITRLKECLIELAGECVEAGVRPMILRRADEMKERFQELLGLFEADGR